MRLHFTSGYHLEACYESPKKELAHVRKPSGVEQEWRLLSSGVDVIVVLELHHG